MNTSKKQSVENDERLLELKFLLMYHLHMDIKAFDSFLHPEEKKTNLKNYWLQKKEGKNQTEEYNARLDKIAKFVSKYINSRKTKEAQ